MHSSNPSDRERARRSAKRRPLAERVARRQVISANARQAKRTAKLICGLVAAALGFLFFGWFGGYAFLVGIGALHYSGMSAGVKESLLGVGFLAIAAAFVLWAVTLEHELRGRPSVPSRRKHAPGSVGGTGLVVTAAGLIPFLIAVALYFPASRSSFTQAHGVRLGATVTEVDNGVHCHRSVCSTDATIRVDLRRPVAGKSESTVSVPHAVSYGDYQPITVLVDPKDPGYAELPGLPDASYLSMIGPSLFALFFFLLGGWLVHRTARDFLRRRRQQGQALRQEVQ